MLEKQNEVSNVLDKEAQENFFWFQSDMELIKRTVADRHINQTNHFIYKELLANRDLKIMHHFRDALQYYLDQEIKGEPLPTSILTLMVGKVFSPYTTDDRNRRKMISTLAAAVLMILFLPVSPLIFLYAIVFASIFVMHAILMSSSSIEDKNHGGRQELIEICVLGLVGFLAFLGSVLCGPFGAAAVVAYAFIHYQACHYYADTMELAYLVERSSVTETAADLFKKALVSAHYMHHFRDAMRAYIVEAMEVKQQHRANPDNVDKKVLMPSLTLFLLQYFISSLADKCSSALSVVLCGLFGSASKDHDRLIFQDSTLSLV